jgi:hypothetical protein
LKEQKPIGRNISEKINLGKHEVSLKGLKGINVSIEYFWLAEVNVVLVAISL